MIDNSEVEGQSADNIELFKLCFRRLSIKDLNDRIENYRSFVEIRSVSEERLKQELKKIFTVKIFSRNFSFFMNVDIQTNQYELFNFFRIRKFKPEDYDGFRTNFFPSMQKPQDAWERPSSDVKNYGRLNRTGESILYVSRETINAIYETGCQVGDSFFLLIYENIKSMRIAQVQNVKYMDDFTEEENAKRIIMHSFLLSEFAKFVPPNREFLYKSSIIIYEEFFLNSQIDGFSYPSVSSPVNRGFNLSFTKDKARENLKFIGVMVCQLMAPNVENEFLIRPLLDGFLNENNSFTFYPYNSFESHEKFGRFIIRREMGL